MFRSTSTRVIFSIIAGAFILASCDKSEDAAVDASILSSADSVLQYVPADSPYVMANVEPLPDDLMDKLEPKLERLLQSYQALLREVIGTKRQALPEERRNSEELQKMNAVIDELMTLLSVDGMREAGIGRDATGALYGNGLLPVVRLQLSDGALFDSALMRLEEKAGHELLVAEVDGHTYRYFDARKVRIMIAVIGNQAVFTVVPASFDEAQIAQAIGVTLPETNIADSGVLQEIAEKYGFTNHYVGFINVPAIVEPLIGTATGVNADLLALGNYSATDLSDVCRAEIRSVAGIVPRIVLGYTEIGVDRLESNAVIELREDIAADLQGLSAAVPGLGGDHGGLMSFGMSMDVKAARAFFEARLDALEAEPFECERFAGVQAGVAGGREALNQPVPPMFYDFKGFLAIIDGIEGLNVATKTPPTSVDGSFLLAMDNAHALISMGAMFSPEVAALDLQTDGKAVPLDLPQVQTLGVAAFAALGENALAISVGEGAESQAESMLGGAILDSTPILSFSMDAARYYSFLGEAMVAGKQDQENAASAEMQAAMNEVMQALAAVYDRMSADILLTERGVEVRSAVTLSE